MRGVPGAEAIEARLNVEAESVQKHKPVASTGISHEQRLNELQLSNPSPPMQLTLSHSSALCCGSRLGIQLPTRLARPFSPLCDCTDLASLQHEPRRDERNGWVCVRLWHRERQRQVESDVRESRARRERQSTRRAC
jgi:hypothetical protein